MNTSSSTDSQNKEPVALDIPSSAQVQTPLSATDTELMFKYYLHQWEQVRHCENTRGALSLQLLTVAAGSIVGYFYIKGCPGLQLVLSLVVMAIGVLGFLVVRSLEFSANIHIQRARAAREHFPLIDSLAKTKGFYPVARYFLSLHVLIIIFGFTLFAMPFLTLKPFTFDALRTCTL